jgi:nucleolin
MNRAKFNSKSNQRQEDSDNESVEEQQNYLQNKQNRDTTKKGRRSSDANEDKKEVSGGCKELFLKNLPWSSDEDSLREFFGKYGEVANVKVLKDRNTGKPRGIGFVEFSSAEEAQAAMDDADNIEIDGRQLTINFSNDKDANRGPRQEGEQRDRRPNTDAGDGTTVFVGNLGFRTSEDTIREFFGDCGTVTSVRIAKGDDGRSKGFCHVDFESNEGVQKAIELNGNELDGRAVRVDPSTGKRSNDRGGFRGGRGGFRGGRGNGRGGRGGRGGFRGNRY